MFQQPKRQASKGSKETAFTPKRAKKTAKAKSPTPSPPTPSPPTPPPSSSTSPSPSPNKSDGDLTNHSFYHSEANSKPTKERHTKKSKASKEPTSSSGKKKEVSKQASKNPSPLPMALPLLLYLTPKMNRRITLRSLKLLVMWLGIHWPCTTFAVVNCAINAILIYPLNIVCCKDLTGFAFKFGNSLPSANVSGSISTHSGLLYLSVVDPGMTSSQPDPLIHSVFLLSDHCLLSTI
ncbi:hypothetical protein DSO57_1029638 [Entomophthora muscae]|uniref:Uncharacterized protein n=1 Tax=Entomophthora muscae TaxID=34485 RepID=A0ACC2RG72_9FUNG|nr:hypothetical protein DSO57_1029638 [Entomophthora muscae]